MKHDASLDGDSAQARRIARDIARLLGDRPGANNLLVATIERPILAAIRGAREGERARLLRAVEQHMSCPD